MYLSFHVGIWLLLKGIKQGIDMLALTCAAAMFRTATATNHLLPYIFFPLKNVHSKGIAIRFSANSTSGNLKSFQGRKLQTKKKSEKKKTKLTASPSYKVLGWFSIDELSQAAL